MNVLSHHLAICLTADSAKSTGTAVACWQRRCSTVAFCDSQQHASPFVSRLCSTARSLGNNSSATKYHILEITSSKIAAWYHLVRDSQRDANELQSGVIPDDQPVLTASPAALGLRVRGCLTLQNRAAPASLRHPGNGAQWNHQKAAKPYGSRGNRDDFCSPDGNRFLVPVLFK